MDVAEELLLLRARVERAESRLATHGDPSSGSAWVGVVVDGGNMPTATPRVFLVAPRRPLWPEAAGAGEAWSEPAGPLGAHPVLVMGGTDVPRAGDDVIVWPIGRGRWAGRRLEPRRDAPGLSPHCGPCQLPLSGLRLAGTFTLGWSVDFDAEMIREKPHEDPRIDDSGGKMPVVYGIQQGTSISWRTSVVSNYWMAECIGPVVNPFVGSKTYLHVILECDREIFRLRAWEQPGDIDNGYSCVRPTGVGNAWSRDGVNGPWYMPTGGEKNLLFISGVGTCDPVNLRFAASKTVGSVLYKVDATLTHSP